MNFKKIAILAAAAFSLAAGFGGNVNAQDRPRVIKSTSSRPVNEPPAASATIIDSIKTSNSAPIATNSYSRPVLTNKIEVAAQPLVKKTGSSSPAEMLTMAASKMAYSSSVSSGMMRGIQARYGIPYLYGASGPNRYDCSGFVWAVFNDAGIKIERTSARTMWNESEAVFGDDRFKFGTLVFFNSLGHIGIVADENGFYQASSSKGITYSKFEGYWEKRIVGFRRLPAMTSAAPAVK